MASTLADGGQPASRDRTATTFLGAVVAGAAVSVLLGVYGRSHDPAGRALFTLGFSGTLNMKAWLATVVLLLAVVQGGLALWMYGKLGRRSAPPWVGPTHRLVGTLTLLVSLPVAYRCLWSLGFETDGSQTRRFVHSILGCAFYGAFTIKILCCARRAWPPGCCRRSVASCSRCWSACVHQRALVLPELRLPELLGASGARSEQARPSRADRHPVRHRLLRDPAVRQRAGKPAPIPPASSSATPTWPTRWAW